jgi:hypothetical protein
MSVQCNQYFCYGYMLDFNKARDALIKLYGEEGYEQNVADVYYDSAFEKEITEVYGCSMIMDGMNGKYIFFGHIYAKSENHQPLETTHIPELTERVKIITEHELNRIFGTDFGVKPEFIFLTHYR